MKIPIKLGVQVRLFTVPSERQEASAKKQEYAATALTVKEEDDG